METLNWLGKDMKKAIFTIISALGLSLTVQPAAAQVTKDDVAEAVDVLKGNSISHTSEWAFRILQDAEDESIRPEARNALGVAYLKGLGVEKDSAMAVKYFEEAGKCGYASAYYNLGLIMKGAPYGKQDFTKALGYFEEGARLGALNCCYLAGYMYYKGLGCRQDYSRAVEYFLKDEKGISLSCQYMLGLCYRNGFGVEKDDRKADGYLRKAALGNYRFAIEETLRENAEVEPPVRLSDSDADTPESMPDVEAFIDRSTDLSGTYSGIIVTYDWSGAQVVREESLSVSFRKTGDSYSGIWIQGTDTLAVNAGIGTDGILRFEDSRMFIKDRYLEGSRIESLFQDASLALLGPSLTGGLRLYSLTEREPQRPMYLSLTRVQDDTGGNASAGCHMAAYPVAGSSQIEVHLRLPRDIGNAALYLSDQSGLPVRSYSLGALGSGEHRFTISTNLRNGLYVVSMKADDLRGHTTIMLK